MNTFLIKFHIENSATRFQILNFITRSEHIKIDEECYVVSSEEELSVVYNKFQNLLNIKTNQNDLLFFVPCEHQVWFYSFSEAARNWMLGHVHPKPSIRPDPLPKT